MKNKTTMFPEMFIKYTGGVQFYTCRLCNGTSIAKNYGIFNYCPFCGRSIKWEEEDEENEI